MKHKSLFIFSVSMAFIAGCVMTYILMTKQQMDAIMQARLATPTPSIKPYQQTTPLLTVEQAGNPPLSRSLDSDGTLTADIVSSTNNSNNNDMAGYSTDDYTQAQAHSIIENMPDVVLEQYVDKFMTKDASNMITDKRRFAERAIEELYQSNDNQPMQADVRLSYQPQMPETSIDTSKIAKDAKLYAHLDTYGRLPTSPFVFVKWVNNDTGQVLLFEKKDIVRDSDQNWVSFQPYDGWQAGSYDIRFYQFTSELQPIGQLTYHIYEVEE